uniref:CARD domain-containing protein n=1 Tax=Esox lucius TaxID=8010 RepID=A0A6Q2Z4R1_ESOLU
MAAECIPEGPDFKELGEEDLWQLINDNRYRISMDVKPCMLIPYLRQARVLTEMDEDEILSCHQLKNSSMRISHMLDLLHIQGRNGAMALLESLMIHYPSLYTQVTGRKPSTEASGFSGLIKYSELTEYLVKAVTGMQKELQEARQEACRLRMECTSLQTKLGQSLEQGEESCRLQAEYNRMKKLLAAAQRDIIKLKDEKCDLYMNYTAAIEERSSAKILCQDLNLQVRLSKELMAEQKECLLLQVRKVSLECQMYQNKCTVVQSQIRELQAERDHVRMDWRCFCVLGLSRASAPPFLLRSRPRAMRLTGRVLTISFQGEALLGQLQVVGGNKTGVFVHQVTEGSAAHAVGISPGAQILEVKYEQAHQALRMVLEDSTLEEAMWGLGQVQGFCHLSLRPNQDGETKPISIYDSEAASGDSFYVRVNMSLPGSTQGSLAVSCNDILHVTSTFPVGSEGSWNASHVHSCQLLDLKTGTVPNYYRAQRLLIRAIEDMSFQPITFKKVTLFCRTAPHQTSACIKMLGDASASRGCVTLMPYTLVTPHYPPICRPILLLPTILGRALDSKLAEWQGFQLCEPEVLTSSEHAARLQRSEVLEECEHGGQLCYTVQGVDRIMKQGTHCVLPLGLDCIRRLHRAEIFPIIIFIAQSKVQRRGWSEEQLLECSLNEEPLLDKLPCLYRSVSPNSWCDSTALLTTLRSIICEEQKKIVWVEPDLW